MAGDCTGATNGSAAGPAAGRSSGGPPSSELPTAGPRTIPEAELEAVRAYLPDLHRWEKVLLALGHEIGAVARELPLPERERLEEIQAADDGLDWYPVVHFLDELVGLRNRVDGLFERCRSVAFVVEGREESEERVL